MHANLYDTILQGDVLDVLRTLPDGCVQTVVTSPPYWGLRDYGTARWEGGDPACGHVQMAVGMSSKNTLGPDGHLPETNAANVGRKLQFRDICRICGARRIDPQIGLEATPQEYVQRMVTVFHEVRRVLRNDGTLWLNLGDSYFGDSPTRKRSTEAFSETWDASQTRSRGGLRRSAARVGSLKPKDLVGVPWMVAFALRDDGWYLRSDIVWAKSNPMPESVTDRPTKSHEYIFLLSKSQRYYYDAEAIREPVTGGSHPRTAGRNSRKYVDRDPAHLRPGVTPKSAKPGSGVKANSSFHAVVNDLVPTRNKRTVWTVATAPYAEAHFATFPPKLIEPCILAGCPAGGIVLDPFFGSGTVGYTARLHSRHYLGIELNPDYIEMAERRIAEAKQPHLWTA